MGGSGGNPVKQLQKGLDDLGKRIGVNDFSNSLVNVATFGLAGVNASGGIGPGAGVRAIDEAVGEISGRNTQRENLNENRARIKQEEIQREALAAAEQKRKRETDISASRAAGGAAGGVRATAPGGSRGQTFNIDQQRDFLGL